MIEGGERRRYLSLSYRSTLQRSIPEFNPVSVSTVHLLTLDVRREEVSWVPIFFYSTVLSRPVLKFRARALVINVEVQACSGPSSFRRRS